MPSTLTDGQLAAISAIERTCSVFSLLGCLFTIITFCCSSSFHKPINRLVFYASFGNMMTNVGTLMSRAYLGDLLSAGCQFQAFLIQMFMPADAFWTLAMAVNVYLTFYYKFDALALRRMEIPYLLLCYGIPMVPAFVFIFVKDSQGNRVYGNALLWCWISSEWDVWRIAAFYAPVWIVIIVTFFIYLRAGRTIYEKRKQLRDFHSTDPDPISINGEAGVYSYRTTEITITSEAVNGADPGAQLESLGRRTSISAAYSAHVATKSASSVNDDAPDVRLPIQGANNHGSDVDIERKAGGVQQKVIPIVVNTAATGHHHHQHHHQQSVISSGFSTRPPVRVSPRRRNHDLNNAAWSYTKCAILFFTAILITWIPSSANRVYSVINKNEISIVLEFMSALVLPLQGFWNAVIYAVTSWSACTRVWRELRLGRRPDVTELVGMSPSRQEDHNQKRAGPSSPSSSFGKDHGKFERAFLGLSKSAKQPSKPFDTESATELSMSRSTSADGSRH